MHDAPPMPQEIRQGFYPGFERAWRRAEIAGRLIMLGVVVATLFGTLGGGPVSLFTSKIAAGPLEVEYPPIVRFGTPTGFTLVVQPRPGTATLKITLPPDLVTAFGLQSVYPHPTEWRSDTNGSLTLAFPLGDGSQGLRVEVGGMPVASGLLKLAARLDDGQVASWSQVVLP